MENNEVVITLLNAIDSKYDMEKEITESFNDKANNIAKTDNLITIDLSDQTILKGEIASSEKTATQLSGMKNYYGNINLSDPKLKEQILMQISLFNRITYFKFNQTEVRERTYDIINRLFKVAKATNGFVLFSNFKIYTPENKLLISPDGKSDLIEFLPIAHVSYVYPEKPTISEQDNNRMNKNIELLEKADIPYYKDMINIPRDFDTNLLSEEDIWKELLSTYTMATIATTVLNEKSIEPVDYICNTLKDKFNIDDILNVENKNIIESIKKEEITDLTKYTWDYEKTAILLWVLSLSDFPSQNQECDVDSMNNLLFYNQTPNELKSKINLRSKEEILEKADLLSRYKWACEEVRLGKADKKLSLNEGIVIEQLTILCKILNWNKN